MKGSTLLLRVVSAVILMVLVLGATFAGSPWLEIALVIAVLWAGHEYFLTCRRGGLRPVYVVGLALAVALAIDHTPGARYAQVSVAVGLLAALLWRSWGGEPGRLWVDLGVTLLGATYIGGLMGYGLPLYTMSQGRAWAAIALLGTWACDSAAFFCGRAFGRHRFLPLVSPKKTWEGTIGGLLATVVACLALILIFDANGWLSLPLWHALPLGLLIGTAAVLGDLIESLLKRALHVKDAGSSIPGHGGLLDRIDGLLVVIPVVYWYARLVQALAG